MFTRQHMEAIAGLISRANDGTKLMVDACVKDEDEKNEFGWVCRNAQVREFAEMFSHLFAEDNPRFKIEKFYAACGIDYEPDPEFMW